MTNITDISNLQSPPTQGSQPDMQPGVTPSSGTIPRPNRDTYRQYFSNIQDVIPKIDKHISDIVGMNNDPERLSLFSVSPQQYTTRQQALIARNPQVAQQRENISQLQQMRDRLIKQGQMLNNDFMTLYGESLGNIGVQQERIGNIMQNQLAGSALGELEAGGFAIGQATGQGATEAMKGKVKQDIEQQGEQQRRQIESDALGQQMVADQADQQTLLSVGGQLQQQQQQDFSNELTLQQLEDQRRRLFGGSSSPSSGSNSASKTESDIDALLGSIFSGESNVKQ